MEHQFNTCSEPLAIASVPAQNWCDPYPWETALYEGTIFPCLNLLFFKAPLSSNPSQSTGNKTEKESLLEQIHAVSFAVNDLTLYLDTHPTCEKGTALFYKLIQKRLELLTEFSEQYYPLTQFSMGVEPCPDSNYTWSKEPMPWEGGSV